MLPLPWFPPDTNWKHSHGLQSMRLGGGAITHETARSRATTIYYDGAGLHDNLASMTMVMLMNVLMVLLLLHTIKHQMLMRC